jgi:hypothetical protein
MYSTYPPSESSRFPRLECCSPSLTFRSATRASWPALRESGWNTFSFFGFEVVVVVALDVLVGAMLRRKLCLLVKVS